MVKIYMQMNTSQKKTIVVIEILGKKWTLKQTALL